MTQQLKVTASTAVSGCKSRTMEKLTEPSRVLKERRRRSLHQMLTASPANPPATARRRPSQSNCRTIRQRDAPRARRTAISLARAVPRARSMLARLRLAMSRDAPAHRREQRADERDRPSSSGECAMLKREAYDLYIPFRLVVRREKGVQPLAQHGQAMFLLDRSVRPERKRAVRLRA